jgi:predicted dehydrogenase
MRDGGREGRVVLLGEGAGADAWAAALRGVAGVELERPAAGAGDELMAALADPATGGVVFAGPRPDLAAAIKRALVARRHVLVAAATAFNERQLATMDHLSRWRQRTLMFATPDVGDGALALVHRLTARPHAPWPPRYVRALRTGGAGAALDSVAMGDIARLVSLLGRPERVSALSPGDGGDAQTALVRLVFAGGTPASLEVCLDEPWARDELTVVSEGRAFVVDAFDRRAPLRVLRTAGRAGPEDESETVVEQPPADGADRTAGAAAAFIAAVRSQDPAASNVGQMALAAAAWQAARTSMSRQGEWTAIGEQRAAAGRPALRVIRGGGRGSRRHAAPMLTVVPATPYVDDAPQPA